jgi:enoyl-CoA hydratase/carnithine racemase
MNEIQLRRLCLEDGTRVLEVVLARPCHANAYTTQMLASFSSWLREATHDGATRALIVRGEGGVFCAGADRAELDARDEHDALQLASRDLFDQLASAPFLTIAAVNGPAVGGGFELALATDVRICSPNAHFRLPEVALGVLPAAGGIRRLLAELGVARTKEFVLAGRTVDALTAERWGLVGQVTEEPLEVARSLAQTVATREPLCIAAAKLMISEVSNPLAGRSCEAVAQALLYGRRLRKQRVSP